MIPGDPYPSLFRFLITREGLVRLFFARFRVTHDDAVVKRLTLLFTCTVFIGHANKRGVIKFTPMTKFIVQMIGDLC